MTARVVLLNGVSSVGKGSVAKALQRIASRPLLHVQMDAFLEMLPAGMFGNPEGYVFETTVEDGKPVTAIHSGPVMVAVMRGMREAVAGMADAGNDLVVDEVMWDPEALADYRWQLATHDFHAVGLFAPLEVIEQRERERGDRTLGLALAIRQGARRHGLRSGARCVGRLARRTGRTDQAGVRTLSALPYPGEAA